MQKHIIIQLLRRESAQVKALIPADMAANAFSYHLNGLVTSGFIEKVERGRFALTANGQRMAGKFSTSTETLIDEIKTVVLLYAQINNLYLMHTWSRQPYIHETTPVYDRIGFGSSLEAGLQLACIEKLGGKYETDYKTSALIKIRKDNVSISHMNALIYEVYGLSNSFSYTGRNGTSQFSSLGQSNCMSGVAEFYEYIFNNSTPNDFIWRY